MRVCVRVYVCVFTSSTSASPGAPLLECVNACVCMCVSMSVSTCLCVDADDVLCRDRWQMRCGGQRIIQSTGLSAAQASSRDGGAQNDACGVCAWFIFSLPLSRPPRDSSPSLRRVHLPAPVCVRVWVLEAPLGFPLLRTLLFPAFFLLQCWSWTFGASLPADVCLCLRVCVSLCLHRVTPSIPLPPFRIPACVLLSRMRVCVCCFHRGPCPLRRASLPARPFAPPPTSPFLQRVHLAITFPVSPQAEEKRIGQPRHTIPCLTTSPFRASEPARQHHNKEVAKTLYDNSACARRSSAWTTPHRDAR